MKTRVKTFLVMEKGKKSKVLRPVAEKGAYFLLGLLFASGTVMGSCSPFAVAFVSVCRGADFLFASLGAAAGYALSGSRDLFLRYTAATLISAIGAFALRSAFVKNALPFSVGISFVSVLATGLVFAFSNSAAVSTYAVLAAESFLAGTAAFFLYRALEAYRRGVRVASMTLVDLCCSVVSFAFALGGLARLSLYSVTLSGILASLLIVCAVRYGSLKWALILALSLGFSLGLSGENMIFLVGAYGFSAMVCSIFLQFGVFFSVFAYVLSMLFFSVAAGGYYAPGVEAIIGVIFFLLLPVSLCDKIENFLSGDEILPEGSLRQSLVVKLRFASSAMASVSQSVEHVSEKIRDIARSEAQQENAALSSRELIAKELIEEKTSQIRLVASEQFDCIADMLMDLSSEFDDAETFDSYLAGKIRSMLLANEITVQSISVITDKYSRSRVEIQTSARESRVAHPRIREEIEKICRKSFENGRILASGRERLIVYSQRPNYKMEIGFSQHSASGGLCGDTIKLINDARGHEVLILSDGMGTGGRAALDGAMASGLLSKLLSAGFGFDASLRVVNSALLVKSNEESLATLDIASIDLFTGRCEFYKAGAVVSYIVKNSSVQKVELSSMPAGILKGIEFAKRTAVLGPGDTVVLLSDGVCPDGTDWLDYYLEYAQKGSCQQTAEAIVANALKRREGVRTDDMSVIVAKLKNNE